MIKQLLAAEEEEEEEGEKLPKNCVDFHLDLGHLSQKLAAAAAGGIPWYSSSCSLPPLSFFGHVKTDDHDVKTGHNDLIIS